MLDRIRAQWKGNRPDPAKRPVAEVRYELNAAIEAGRRSCRESATMAQDTESRISRLSQHEQEATERGELELAKALRVERECLKDTLTLLHAQHELMAQTVEQAEAETHRLFGTPQGGEVDPVAYEAQTNTTA